MPAMPLRRNRIPAGPSARAGGSAARVPAVAEADGEDGLGDDFIVNDEQDAEGEYDDE